MDWFTKSPQETLEELGVDKNAGLDAGRVEENRARYGRNAFTELKKKSLLRRIYEAATEPMLLLLILAWAITIAVNIMSVVRGGSFDWAECIGILAAIFISITLTIVMEGRSAKAFAELNKIKEGLEIKVVRGGVVQYVVQQDLVVGDIVYLETGNKVAADGRLLETVSLLSDESSLTGESAPISKDADAVLEDPKTPVAERRNMVYSGCFIMGGVGKMIVTDVGDNTEFGLIAREIQHEDDSRSTPLQEKMDRLGKKISLIGAIAAGIIFLIQLFYILFAGTPSFESISESFINSIVLIIAAVPEGLPTIVAISLSINIARMARENALVKKLIACETIGCVNVICSDKTGTLTENRMTVLDVWTGGGYLSAEDVKDTAVVENWCLNGTADLYEDKGQIRFVGNPTEGALLVAAGKAGADYKSMREEAEAVKVFPFSSDRKNMTTCIRRPEGIRIYTKGSPEKILSFCSVGAEERESILGEIEGLEKKARRVIAFAHRTVPECPETQEDAERDMIFDGFVGIADPLRGEVYDSVRTCRSAGIELKMLTGDNIVTATAIAQELGILEEGTLAVEASYLDSLSDEEFGQILPKVRVIARSTPMLKMRVVRTLRGQGNVVAVTGDGINDAPALKSADVGIAMGISGTEVSKEAAEIVLLNDSFSTIVTTVKWGRGIYENFKRFIQFQLTVNVASVLFVFLCTVVGLFVEGFASPFTSLDLLWINIIMDGPPALTLGLEPMREGLMNEKPTPRNENIVSGAMMRRITMNGVFICLVCLAQLYWNFLCVPEADLNTSVFTLFVMFQMFNAFNCRELGGNSIFPNLLRNRLMLGAFGIVFVLQIVITQWGGAVFSTTGLGILDWLKVIGLAFSIILLNEGVKLILRAVSGGKKAARA